MPSLPSPACLPRHRAWSRGPRFSYNGFTCKPASCKGPSHLRALAQAAPRARADPPTAPHGGPRLAFGIQGKGHSSLSCPTGQSFRHATLLCAVRSSFRHQTPPWGLDRPAGSPLQTDPRRVSEILRLFPSPRNARPTQLLVPRHVYSRPFLPPHLRPGRGVSGRTDLITSGSARPRRDAKRGISPDSMARTRRTRAKRDEATKPARRRLARQ